MTPIEASIIKLEQWQKEAKILEDKLHRVAPEYYIEANNWFNDLMALKNKIEGVRQVFALVYDNTNQKEKV